MNIKVLPVPAFPLTKTLCPHITRSTTLLCSSFKVCPVMFYTENVKKTTWSLLFSLLNSWSTHEEICTLRQSLRQSCPHDVKSERFFTFSEIFVHSRLLSIVYDSPRKLCEWEIPNTFRKSCLCNPGHTSGHREFELPSWNSRQITKIEDSNLQVILEIDTVFIYSKKNQYFLSYKVKYEQKLICHVTRVSYLVTD